MSIKQQNEIQMSIYMPSIFWHDRQGILSIDVLQQQMIRPNGVPIYKIATASMQNEIRVWNFHFESSEVQKKSAENTSIEPKAQPLPTLVPKRKTEEEVVAAADEIKIVTETEMKRNEDSESIVFLEHEKENEGGSNKDVEMKDDLEVVEVVNENMETEKGKNKQQNQPAVSLSVEFLANLEGHRITPNVVRFSPNGKYLASGDANGNLLVWEHILDEEMDVDGNEKKAEEEREKKKNKGDPEMDIPPNKENWDRTFRTSMAYHDSDITAICFSPDSQLVASVSMSDSVAINRADTGKRVWMKRGFRHFANGIVWDPRGKYIVTLSTDRRMDVLDTQKGTVLRSCHQVEFPLTKLPGNNSSAELEISRQVHKLFHDDQLCSFQRSLDFSPCGGVVFAPAAHLEINAHNIYGTYAFRRADLNHCRPTALFPTLRPTIQIKCSPILYNLEMNEPNFLELPHRLIFAVLCRDSIFLYNSQCNSPFAYMENLHYDKLSSISWTPDGLILVVSSLEGFNSFIRMDTKKLGTPCDLQPDFLALQQQQKQEQIEAQSQKTPVKDATANILPSSDATPKHGGQLPPYISLQDSPKLITPRRSRAKKTLNAQQAANSVTGETTMTPKVQQGAAGQEGMGDGSSVNGRQQSTEQSPVPKKKARKVQLVSLDEEGVTTSEK